MLKKKKKRKEEVPRINVKSAQMHFTEKKKGKKLG